MDHFQTVGYLKCAVLEVYIKSFGGQKGGSLEPPRTSPAYGPEGLIDSLMETLCALPILCGKVCGRRS